MNLSTLVSMPFAPLTEEDYEVFSGASGDALIAYSEVAVYIVDGDRLSVITDETETQYYLGCAVKL